MPIFHTDSFHTASFHTASNSNIRANLPASGPAPRPAGLPAARIAGRRGAEGRWEAGSAAGRRLTDWQFLRTSRV